MKKLCIYLMLVLLAADTTELHQLLKLPVLFEHFAEHKERDKSVSFATFISMHYWGNDLNDNDDDRDMQLPFKKLDVHPTHVLFLSTVRTVLNLTPEKHILTNYPVYQHQYFPNPALASPFRPPCV